MALRLAATALLCLWAPGWAWWPRRSPDLPASFARVGVSVILTTLVATLATAAQRFSLGAVVSINAAITLAGVLEQRRRRRPATTSPTARPADNGAKGYERLGVAVFVAALLAYWPAYPTFFGAGDSSAYVDSGVSLARSGTLAKHDDLATALDHTTRAELFDSMAQRMGGGPPYRRMPGAMMLRSLDADTAWPAFFPVPAVWAALCASALGARHAGTYAPLFTALGLWAFFVLASRWFGVVLGLFATLLVGANGATYYLARLPLSEQLAWFFAWCGLAAATASLGRTDDGRGSGLPALTAKPGQKESRPLRDAPMASTPEATLAGAAFGAAIFTRVDFALFVGGALLLLPSLEGPARRRALPRAFFAALVAVALLCAAELAALPGSYVDPLTDSAQQLLLRLQIVYAFHPVASITAVVATTAAGAVAVARFGAVRTMRVALVVGFLAAHATASNYLAARTPMWLSFYVGWTGLALAAAGALRLLRSRLPGASLFLALLAAVSLVLFYNPHVYPTLPWGARRFVPVLIPGVILAATAAVAAAWRWRRAAGAIAAVALVVPVVAGGRPVWGQRFFDGAPEQLERFAAALPDDGVVLINRSLSPHMLGAALWLLYDRNSLAVFPENDTASRALLSSLVRTFASGKPVYWVTNALETQFRIPFVERTPIARTNLVLPLLEQTYDRRPQRRERYLTPIAIFRLNTSTDGRDGAAR